MNKDTIKIKQALEAAKSLIKVARMPNAEYVADAHNAAVDALPGLLAALSTEQQEEAKCEHCGGDDVSLVNVTAGDGCEDKVKWCEDCNFTSDAQPQEQPVAWLEKAANSDAWFLAYSENPNAERKPLYLAAPSAAHVQPASQINDVVNMVQPASKPEVVEHVKWLIDQIVPIDKVSDNYRREAADLIDTLTRCATSSKEASAPARDDVLVDLIEELGDVETDGDGRDVIATAIEFLESLRTQPQATAPEAASVPAQAVLTDAPFKLVDIISTGYEGWANLIYTGPEWQGGCVAMCPPPVAEAFRRLLAGSAKTGEAE